jgi:hypothetical protein
LLTAIRLPGCTNLPRLCAHEAKHILISDAPAPPAGPKAPVTAHAFLCVHELENETCPAWLAQTGAVT